MTRANAEAFLEQNEDFAADLTANDRVLVEHFAMHHAGGLFVLIRPLGGSWYVKTHDSWGDPDDPNEGRVVVHRYDADDIEAEGWEERQSFFSGGHAALEAFLNAEIPGGA